MTKHKYPRSMSVNDINSVIYSVKYDKDVPKDVKGLFILYLQYAKLRKMGIA